MKQKKINIIFHVFTLCSLFVGLSFQGITPVLAAPSSTNPFINSNGTLNLTANYHGNLDIKNYNVTLDPLNGPVLKPLATLGTWSALGTVAFSNTVSTIVMDGTDVYIGGDFVDAGGNPNADHIAKWNGTTWSALGAGLNNRALSIAISGTDLYAGGFFDGAGGDDNADFIAKWNGTTWSSLGTIPLDNAVYTVAVSGTDVYIGGAFLNAGGDPNADRIAKWDTTNSTWSGLNIGLNDGVNVISISGTDLYVGGYFTDAADNLGNLHANHIAKWDTTNSTWSTLGAGLNDIVRTIVAVDDTNIYAGGDFTDADGVVPGNADYIAKWDGTSWSAISSTPLASGSSVYAIVVNGTDIYAGGDFTDAGGNPNADNIVKWDGTTWSSMSVGLTSNIFTIFVNGSDVYAGGTFLNAGGNATADYLAMFRPDTTAPTVQSSLRGVEPNPTDKASVHFTVHFSEAVTGVDKTDFNLTAPGITGATVSAVTGSGSTYTVTVTTGNGNGTIRLNVINNGSITDIPGNPLASAYNTGQAFTVNKTRTFTSLAAQDGWVLKSTENSGVGGSGNNGSGAITLGDNIKRQQYRSILSFNTSLLPDTAVITGITLKIKKTAVVGGGDPVKTFKGFMIDIKKGIFGTSVLQVGDFQAVASQTLGPLVITPPATGWYTFNLLAAKNNINKLTTSSGLTQIRLRFKLDDNNNKITNTISFSSGNAAATLVPQLIITYYVP